MAYCHVSRSKVFKSIIIYYYNESHVKKRLGNICKSTRHLENKVQCEGDECGEEENAAFHVIF